MGISDGKPYGIKGLRYLATEIDSEKVKINGFYSDWTMPTFHNTVLISSQNHGYAVDEKSLAGLNVEITNISLNDGTIEGLRYLDHPSFAVQYHPEASPGPGGHEYLFKRFVKMMGGQN